MHCLCSCQAMGLGRTHAFQALRNSPLQRLRSVQTPCMRVNAQRAPAPPCSGTSGTYQGSAGKHAASSASCSGPQLIPAISIIRTASGSSSGLQRWALERLGGAAPSPSLRSSFVFLGLFVALAAHGGAAHAGEAAAETFQTHHHSAQAVFGDVASNEDFWQNVGAYARFFVTVMLGTANVVTKPFRDAAKSPLATAGLLLGAAGLFVFMTFTVKLMLGIGGDAENFEYLTRGI